MEDTWKQKALHGKFVNDKEGVNWEKSWQWIVRGGLKGCTEALIYSAQGQALQNNYIELHIDKNAESPLCRMCGERGETISHLVSESGKLAQKDYKQDMIMWLDMFIGCYVEWAFLNEQINGMTRSQMQLLKMRTLSFCGTSPFNAIE